MCLVVVIELFEVVRKAAGEVRLNWSLKNTSFLPVFAYRLDFADGVWLGRFYELLLPFQSISGSATYRDVPKVPYELRVEAGICDPFGIFRAQTDGKVVVVDFVGM